MENIDKYNLKQSTVSPIIGTEELTKDLQLSLSPTSQEGILTGTVITTGDVLVLGATVKVFDSNNIPIAHDTTNEQGKFNIPNLVKGSYMVTAAKDGYLTPTSTSVAIVANKPTNITINILPDLDAARNTLYGKVREASTLNPIEGAIVNIYNVVGGEETIVTTTRTNSTGQYLAPNLVDGDYTVKANKQGYDESVSQIISLSDDELANLNLSMTIEPLANTGTISGFISDETTLVGIPNATVALYLVNGGTETIVQLTKTNAAGRYLFGNVVEGNYLVKALSQTTL